jgi:hypothetical protein
MNTAELLEKQKAIHIKNFVSEDLLKFFTNVLMRYGDIYPRDERDLQVPTAPTMKHEIMFETLLERSWPIMEEIVGEDLIPTYSYARLYSNGDKLKPHLDRPACEVSVTIQLGRSHHYAWPIFMGNARIDMAEGDAVIYKGCEIEHWRNVCDGPEGYYSGQVFLHYVKANGVHAEHGWDKKFRTLMHGPLVKNMFVKNRALLMDVK